MFLNASSLGANSHLELQLLDNTFQPIAGYSAVIGQSGFRIPVIWQNQAEAGSALGEIHVQIRFEGARPEDASLHALYLVPESP